MVCPPPPLSSSRIISIVQICWIVFVFLFLKKEVSAFFIDLN